MKKNKAKSMTTTNQGYGEKNKTLEIFVNSTNNIVKSADLMPCPRRPPKNDFV